MTNPPAPNHDVGLPAELITLARIGGRQRPVKLVEHPTFRAARARRALDPALTVHRVSVVSLDRPTPVTAGACHSTHGAPEAA